MKFNEFMDMYDDWNGYTSVSDDDLDVIVENLTWSIMDTRKDLFDREVIAFGFYGGVLTVRIK